MKFYMKTGSWNPCAVPGGIIFFFFFLHNKAGLTNKRERNTSHERSETCCQHAGPDHFRFLSSTAVAMTGGLSALFWFCFSVETLKCWMLPSSLFLSATWLCIINFGFFFMFRYCYHFEDQKESSVVESFRFFYHEWATKLKCTFALNRQRN